MNLDEVLERVQGLDPSAKAALAAKAQEKPAKFIPNPGPQTDAWFSKADVLLYGGEAGGGKSGLLCGLALMEHRQTLLMRRNGVDFEGGGGLIEELLKLNGTRDGFSGKSPPTLRTDDGRIITFGSATNLGDEQKYMGRARDLLGIDEATQFSESQIRFLMGWVRTTHEGQRTRTVFATNPPISAEGEWVVRMFRPWLDLTHPKPAKVGELRWYVTVESEDIEVDGPEPVEIGGHTLLPTSRTFIPAALKDNPFIIRDEYQKQLDALPEPYRSAIRDGNFMAARRDDEWQVIPTDWIRAAQERWTADPPDHAPMCAMGVDVAQGGADQTVLAARYDGWFSPIIAVAGKTTPTGGEVAGLVIKYRKHRAVVVIDMDGGWGGDAYSRLKDNNIECRPHKGSAGSVRRTVDGMLKFRNKRAEVWWRFREALDPGQDDGSVIALPPDQELVADLTAPRFKVTPSGIQIEEKSEIKKRLGRSPDKGDAVTMAWSGGPKMPTHGRQWKAAINRERAGRPNIIKGRR